MVLRINSKMGLFRRVFLAAMLAVLAGPAQAGVKEGVDAWSRGDYAAAVREWEAPAAAGDADAIFNLAQAYRLGRGVATDLARAESLYARAAALGHVRAADIYGLMLFQDGRREQALPYIRGAAERGDPRSQYLLGIAHFNGDLVSKDWVRAYALMVNANRQGLPQAAEALTQMDAHIPFAERQKGAGLARRLEADAEAALARELAAADLSAGEDVPAHQVATPSLAAGDTAQPPRTVPPVAVAPSTAAAQAAVSGAMEASGTGDPAQAGASYARGAQTQAAARQSPAPRPTAEAPAQVAQASSSGVPSSRPASQSVRAAGGPWRVQLGAFSVKSNADRLWTRLSGRPELSGAAKLMVPSGRVTRLLAGGYASKADADAACRMLKSSGQDCLVTTN